MAGVIRPLALCVLRDGERILLMRGHDEVKGETFYRPLGGGIEFGEDSADCVRREIREELGAEVDDLQRLGTIENRFTYNGRAGHEIVILYVGRLCDAGRFAAPIIRCQEDDGVAFEAVWKRLDDFLCPSGQPLYPAGLLELLLPRASGS